MQALVVTRRTGPRRTAVAGALEAAAAGAGAGAAVEVAELLLVVLVVLPLAPPATTLEIKALRMALRRALSLSTYTHPERELLAWA